MNNKNKLAAFVLVLGIIFIFSASKTVLSAPIEKGGKTYSQAGLLGQGGYFNLTDGRKPNINRRGDRGNHNNYNERSREGDRYRDRGERNNHERNGYERRDRDRDRDRDGDGYRHERERHRRDRD